MCIICYPGPPTTLCEPRLLGGQALLSFPDPRKVCPRLGFSYLDRVLIFLPWANRKPFRMQREIIPTFLLQLHCHVGRGSIKARLEDGFWDVRWALGQPRPTPSSMSVDPITSCKGQTEEAFCQNTSASHMKHLFIQVNLTQTLQHLSQIMVWTTQFLSKGHAATLCSTVRPLR